MTQDLDLVPTTELLDALKQRFDVFAMVGLFDRGAVLKTEDIAYAFRGEPFACMGATQFLRVKIEQHLLHNIQDNE